MGFRLQCNVCGAKSPPVEDPAHPTCHESQGVGEFRAEHEATCGLGSLARETRAYGQAGPFGAPRPDPRSVRRPHGHTERTGPYGEEQECDTLQCCHCGGHWEVRATCGRPGCAEHLPYEQRLRNVERGLPELTPLTVSALVQMPSGLYLGRDHGPTGAAGGDPAGAPAAAAAAR